VKNINDSPQVASEKENEQKAIESIPTTTNRRKEHDIDISLDSSKATIPYIYICHFFAATASKSALELTTVVFCQPNPALSLL